MVGATDLLESNEDMTFSSSILSPELTKKETLDQKSFYVKIKLSLVFLSSIEEKQLLKKFEIAIELEMPVP